MHNSLAVGLGFAHTRHNGIPQGRLLSMMLIGISMRPLMVLMLQYNVIPRTFADDILFIGQGLDHLTAVVKGVTVTHRFLHNIGARIAPDKSTLSSIDATTRKWMSTNKWGDAEVTIGVVKSFRDLGGHMNMGIDVYSKTLITRMKEAIALAYRGGRLLVSLETKAKIIRTKILAKALYVWM